MREEGPEGWNSWVWGGRTGVQPLSLKEEQARTPRCLGGMSQCTLFRSPGTPPLGGGH